MAFTVQTTDFSPDIDAIIASVLSLAGTEVVVGIPESESARGDGMSNVALAYLHTYGSPLNNIPARPFLEPALWQEDVEASVSEHVRSAALSAFSAKPDEAMRELDLAGTVGETAVKEYFGSGALAPNSPATARRKGSNRPLIDTGALRNSVTHAVRKRK